MLNLNEVVGTSLNENGVTTVTRGALAMHQVRSILSGLLQQADPAGYAEYRKLKRPAGKGSDTPETRQEAQRFLFDRARDLLVPFYIPTRDLQK
jgi:hypothetical protein